MFTANDWKPFQSCFNDDFVNNEEKSSTSMYFSILLKPMAICNVESTYSLDHES
jgi:hypothetical protein